MRVERALAGVAGQRLDPGWLGPAAAHHDASSTGWAFRQKRLEQHAIVCALGFLPRESLPTSDSDIDKERVDLNAEADPPAGLRRDQRGPAAQKRLVDRLPGAGIVQHRPAHALDRLLGRMLGFDVLPTGRNSPKRRLLAVTGPVALLSDSVPAGLVLPVVVALAHHQALLGPDDLRPDRETALG